LQPSLTSRVDHGMIFEPVRSPPGPLTSFTKMSLTYYGWKAPSFPGMITDLDSSFKVRSLQGITSNVATTRNPSYGCPSGMSIRVVKLLTLPFAVPRKGCDKLEVRTLNSCRVTNEWCTPTLRLESGSYGRSLIASRQKNH
jgi:hypothetical protein